MNTLITAFLNGGKLNSRLNDYLDSIHSIINTGINIVLFVDDTTKHHFLESPTVKIYNFNITQEFPYGNLVENLRNHPNFTESANWVKNPSQGKYQSHNPIIMSKPYMVKKAIELNPFNSDKFVWYDGGMLKNREQFGMGHLEFKTEELTYLFDLFTPSSMYFMSCGINSNDNEIHGFRKDGIIKIINTFPDYCLRGGNFGGGINPLIEFVTKYDFLLKQTLEMGYMGTEETIFTLLNELNPNSYIHYKFPNYSSIYQSIYNQSIL